MPTKTKYSVKTVLRLYGGFVLMPLGIAVLIYCMLKAVDRGMVIDAVKLLEKHGGKSGSWGGSSH